MIFRTPAFWYSSNKFLKILAPLGVPYWLAGWLRQKLIHPQKVSVPVICVGNVVAGGAGKTPVVQSLISMLKAKGIQAHVISEGYGGRIKKPTRVDPKIHTFEDVGDEALLLSQSAPVWIGKSRVKAAMQAVAAGAQTLILDDGFQDPSLYKDFSIIVIDGEVGFGNGMLIPAGPLREPVSRAIERTNAVVLIENDKGQRGNLWSLATKIIRCVKGDGLHGKGEQTDRRDLPIWHAEIVPDAANLQGKKAVAFAGIGRPEKFFSTCRSLGAELIETKAFPDHHAYTQKELDDLVSLAEVNSAILLTTSKDAVRLPEALKAKITVVSINLKWTNVPELNNALAKIYAHQVRQ